jgi:hypothetical protein
MIAKVFTGNSNKIDESAKKQILMGFNITPVNPAGSKFAGQGGEEE